MPDNVNATPFYLNQQPIGEPWGNNMPRLIRLDDDTARYYVGNRPDFNLPMTGGTGPAIFIFSGMAAILAGTGVAMAMYRTQKNKRMSSKEDTICS